MRGYGMVVGLVLAVTPVAVGQMTAPATASATGTAPATSTAPAAAQAVIVAGRGQSGVARVVTADNAEETRTAAARMAGILEKVDAEGVTLKDFVRGLAAAAKVNVAVNWGDVRSVKVTPETKIDLRLRDVSAYEALTLALEIAAPGQLEVLVSEGVVEVGTRARQRRQVVLRTYDPELLWKQAFHETATAPATQGGDGIAALFRAVVTPGVWEEKGHAVRLVEGKLIVAGAARSQWEAGGLYQDLLRPIRMPADAGGKVALPAWLRVSDRLADLEKNLRMPVKDGESLVVRWPGGFDPELLPVVVAVPWQAAAGTPQLRAGSTRMDVLSEALMALQAQQAEGVELTGDVTPEGTVLLTRKGAEVDRSVIAVFDMRDRIRRVIYKAPRDHKPGTAALAAELLSVAKASAGTAARQSSGAPVVAEWEGRIVVRATPEVQRAVAAALAGK